VALVILAGGAAASERVVRGRLETSPGKPLGPDQPLVLLTENGEKYKLSGDEFSEGQLRDGRLAGRLWELEGSLEPDGRFKIHKLFTVKDGKRFLVTYFCVVCNIRSHEPGRCMCCQDQTELQELPEE
jgi:hypothetical protein